MTRDVELTGVRIEYFKRLREIEVRLGRLNVLVGGNNSGKSSLLQAIHFGVTAATAARQTGRETFTQDALLYCPAADFTELRHGEPYLNQSNFGVLRFIAKHLPTGEDLDYQVTLYRARNEGNVGCRRRGDVRLGQLVTDDESPFSIYVPGLAGIPRSEQFRSEGVIRRGVAGGDANLYLRNVLFLIKEKGRMDRLVSRMRHVFPDFWIDVKFDPRRSVEIEVRVSTTGEFGRVCVLDLAGTGVLQALQIFSYITLFEPRLLLLDEPDAHLHANNQALLARAMISATAEFETQIVCSTHSRHLVDALHDDAHFVWLRSGELAEQGGHLPRLPLLLDLGAVDGMDRIRAGEVDWFVLSEDSDYSMLKVLLASAGFNVARCEIRSYAASSRLEAAIELASYIRDESPRTRVLIHRDRDFMTVDEVDRVKEKIMRSGAHPFITRGSDVESYFVDPEHIAVISGSTASDVREWLDALATSWHVVLQHQFTRKRDDVKATLYRGRSDGAPDTADLLGRVVPLSAEKRMGKEMLRRCRDASRDKFGRNHLFSEASAGLDVSDLLSIRLAAESL
jgi:ABC-type cobalamin/Fe3+-siderophores transport system ATPase subunit